MRLHIMLSASLCFMTVAEASASRTMESSSTPSSALKSTTRMVAQGGDSAELCGKLRDNRDICQRNLDNIGGGSDGQAGSFRQCVDMYTNALVAAGCGQ